MAIDKAVLKQVSDELQAYVYMLVDPDYGVPFYVGKSYGMHHDDHVAEVFAFMAEAISPVTRTTSHDRPRPLLEASTTPSVRGI